MIKYKNEYYIINDISIDDSDRTVVTISATHECSELNNKQNGKFEEIAKTVGELVSLVLEDTDWFFGGTDIPDSKKRYLLSENESVFTNLVTIAEVFNARLDFNTNSDGRKSVSVYQNSIKNGRYITKGKDLKNVNISYNTDEMVTRLTPFGAVDDAINQPVDIMDVNPTHKSYVDNFNYYLNQGYTMEDINKYPTKFIKEKTIDNTDCRTSQQLYDWAIEELERISVPKVNCSVDIADISVLEEFMLEPYSLGETVTIFDTDIDLEIEADINSFQENLDNPFDSTISISNIKEKNSVLKKMVDSANVVDKVVDSNNQIKGTYIAEATIDTAHIKELNAKVIVAESIYGDKIHANTITGKHISSGSITAEDAIFAQGAIGSADISDLSANKLTAGVINTAEIKIVGTDNVIEIENGQILVNDTSNLALPYNRLIMGKYKLNPEDEEWKYGFVVRGADGKTVLLDENGVTNAGITDGAVDNNKISVDANIDGSKLNIQTTIKALNNYTGSEKLNGVLIEIDGMSLSTKFYEMDNLLTEHGELLDKHTSEIQQNATNIKLSVTQKTYYEDKQQLESDLKNVQDSIANMQIGGNNLFIGTKDWGSKVWENVDIDEEVYQACKVAKVKGVDPNCIATNLNKHNFKFNEGQTYTISMCAKGKIEGLNLSISISQAKSAYEPQVVTTDWALYTWTFDSLTEDLTRFLIQSSNATDTNYISVCRLKVELGNKATDWCPSFDDSSLAIEDVKQQLNDIKADNKLTPNEKQDLLREITAYKAEKFTIDLQCSLYPEVSVEQSNFNIAYNELIDYIDPLLDISNMNKTTEIDAESFTNYFNNYFDTKTALLSKLAKVSKDKVDEAQNTADTAKENASQAQGEIDKLNNINELTPSKKQELNKEWINIKNSYNANLALANVYSDITTEKNNYTIAYDALNSLLPPLLTNLTTTQTIDGVNLTNKLTDFYNKQNILLKKINEVSKSIAEDAQYKVENLNIGERNLVLNSNFARGIENWLTSLEPKIKEENGLKYVSIGYSWECKQKIRLEKGQTYTLSLLIRNTVEDNSLFRLAIQGQDQNQDVYIGDLKNSWERRSVTFIFDKDTNDKNLYFLKQSNNKSNNIEFTEIKLIKGDVTANDWSPAPEDTQTILDDIFADNMITPNEKQSLSREWEEIKSEYIKNKDVATQLKIVTELTDYTTKYNDLKSYMDIILKDMSLTTSINPQEFDAAYNNYTNAKVVLLSKISTETKKLADNAQNTADTANKTANENAGALNNMTRDDKLTPVEKLQVDNIMQQIIKEKSSIVTQAQVFAISTTDYVNKYNVLYNYIYGTNGLLANINITSDIIRTDFQGYFNNYYISRQNVLNIITQKSKEASDKALEDSKKYTDSNVEVITKKFTDLGARVEVTENAINDKVWETDIEETTTIIKDYVDNTVDNMEIGGRNLWLNSSFNQGLDSYSLTPSAGTITLDDKKFNGNNVVVFDRVGTVFGDRRCYITTKQSPTISSFKKGDEFILTAWVYIERQLDGVDISNIMIRGTSGDNPRIDIPTTADVVGKWIKLTSNVFKAGADGTFSNCYVLLGGNGKLKVSQIQLEKGNKATDWTPAPEDVQDNIDNIQIGGRNLLVNSEDLFLIGSDHVNTSKREKGKVTVLTSGAFNAYTFVHSKVTTNAYLSKTVKELSVIDKYLTVSVDIKTTNLTVDGVRFKFDVREAVSGQSRDEAIINITPNRNGEWVRYSATLKVTSIDRGKSLINLYNFPTTLDLTGVIIEYRNCMIEEGNKASAYSKAPEDVENNLNDLEDTMNGAFKDGILSDAEKKAIKQSKQTIYGDMTEANNTYTTLNNNINLINPQKQNLTNAKAVFNNAWTSLNSFIDNALNSDMVTPSIIASIDSAFNTYRNSLGEFNAKIQEAIDSINSKKIDDIQVGGRNLLLNSKGDFVLTPRNDGTDNDNYNFYVFYADMILGETYTISADIEITHGSFDYVTILPYEEGTKYNAQIPINKRVSHTFTKQSEKTNRILIYAGVAGKTHGNGIIIRNVKVEKGNKATDWTPAPEDVEANINNLEDTMNGAFKDGLLSESEKKAIKQSLNIIKGDMTEADKIYETLNNNSNLVGTPKTNLYQEKMSYNNAYVSLVSFINTALSSSIVTEEMNKSIDSAFDTYRTSLGLFNQRVQEAIDSINSQKVDKIEIGGRNLILDSYDAILTANNQKTKLLTTCDDILNVINSSIGKPFIFSVDVELNNCTGSVSSGNQRIGAEVALKHEDNTYSYIGCWTKPDVGDSIEKKRIYGNPIIIRKKVTSVIGAGLYIQLTCTNSTISKPKLEIGNKATDWTPAPEDIENNLNDLENTMNGAFKDGVLSDAEKKAIKQSLNIIEGDAEEVQKQYDIVYNNANLIGTPKTNLINAKTSYNSAYNSLVSFINTALNATIVTDNQVNSIQSAFGTYRTTLGTFQQRLQEAIDSINSKKVDDLQIGGRNLLLDSGEEITTKSTDYLINRYETSGIKPSTKYTLVIKGKVAQGKKFGVWLNGASSNVGYINAETESTIGVLQFTSPSTLTNQLVSLYNYPSNVEGVATIEWVTMYEGYIKPSLDWTPAPEDAEKNLTDLEDTMNGAFKDNVLSESEKKSIRQSLQIIKGDLAQADNIYTTLNNNPNLTGTPKTSLTNSKVSYNSAYNSLVSFINTALGASIVTDEMLASINSAFDTYRITLGTFNSKVQEAIDFINSKKVDDINIGGRNLLKPIARKGGSNTSVIENGIKIDLSTSVDTYFYLDLYNKVTLGDILTLSFDVSGLDGTLIMGITNQNKNHLSLTNGRVYKTFVADWNFDAISMDDIKRETTSGDIRLTNFKLEKGNKATDYTPAPEDVEDFAKEEAKKVETKVTEKVTEVTKTVDGIKEEIKSTTNKITTITKDLVTVETLAKAMSNGKSLKTDPVFRKGMNGVSLYNNAANGNVSLTRITRPSDCPTTSTHCLQYKCIGTASPNLGGFVVGVNGRANAKFVIRVIAKMPVGYTINTASNSMGTGYTDKIITDNTGTGNYQEYIRLIQCGSTGTFSGGGHFYISGATPTSANPLYVNIASVELYDITDSDERLNELTTSLSENTQKIAEVDKKADSISNRVKTTEENISSVNNNVTAQEKRLQTAETKLTDSNFAVQIQRNQNKVYRFRYIRDYISGSTVNTSNHWIEIQAINNLGVNIAKGKTVSGSGVSNAAFVTDGNTTGSYASGGSTTYVQIDLGAIYEDIDCLKIWHYYSDSRTYHNSKTQISTDGTNWITVFDSSVSGEYKETEYGHTIKLNDTGQHNSMMDFSENGLRVSHSNANLDTIMDAEGFYIVPEGLSKEHSIASFAGNSSYQSQLNVSSLSANESISLNDSILYSSMSGDVTMFVAPTGKDIESEGNQLYGYDINYPFKSLDYAINKIPKNIPQGLNITLVITGEYAETLWLSNFMVGGSFIIALNNTCHLDGGINAYGCYGNIRFHNYTTSSTQQNLAYIHHVYCQHCQLRFEGNDTNYLKFGASWASENAIGRAVNAYHSEILFDRCDFGNSIRYAWWGTRSVLWHMLCCGNTESCFIGEYGCRIICIDNGSSSSFPVSTNWKHRILRYGSTETMDFSSITQFPSKWQPSTSTPPPTPTVKTYTTTWTVTSVETYVPVLGTYEAGKCRQGWYASNRGNYFGMANFNVSSIKSTLSGATITASSVTVTRENSSHGYNSAQTIYVVGKSGRTRKSAYASKSGFNRGTTQTISCGVTLGNNLRDGVVDGIGFYAPNANTQYEDYVVIAPTTIKITITYQK